MIIAYFANGWCSSRHRASGIFSESDQRYFRKHDNCIAPSSLRIKHWYVWCCKRLKRWHDGALLRPLPVKATRARHNCFEVKKMAKSNKRKFTLLENIDDVSLACCSGCWPIACENASRRPVRRWGDAMRKAINVALLLNKHWHHFHIISQKFPKQF